MVHETDRWEPTGGTMSARPRSILVATILVLIAMPLTSVLAAAPPGFVIDVTADSHFAPRGGIGYTAFFHVHDAARSYAGIPLVFFLRNGPSTSTVGVTD